MPRQGCVIRDVSQTIRTGCWLQGRVVCRWPNCTRAIYHVRKVLVGFSILVDTHGSIVCSVYAAVPLGMTGGAWWNYNPYVSIYGLAPLRIMFATIRVTIRPVSSM